MSDGTVVNRPTAAPNLPQIPGLKLISIAGQGGMGTVYRAEQLSPRRTVAVKVLTRSSGSPETLAAFRREAETIAHLEHPNILPVYGFGEVDGAPYLILRYLAGGSVALRLRRGRLELPMAVRWVRSVAAALDFAHSHGLVHRDVKPSNMLLDEAGNAYLSDFGIAAALSAGDDKAGIGSAAYMSPEQGRGEPVDRRADLYALGVSLFEMLTGEKPYTAESALGMIVRHINDPIPSARALNPKTPPAVDELIRRAMAKDPADRPQTASEFAALLAQAAGQPAEALPVGAGRAPSPTIVVPGGVPPAASRAPSRGINPMVWAVAGTVVICLVGSVLLGGGGLAAILLNRTATPRPSSTAPAVTPTVGVTPSPAGQLLADDFSNPASGFAQKPDVDGSVGYAAGVLKINVLTLGREFYAPSQKLNVEGAIVGVDVQLLSGPGSSYGGVLCRFVKNTDHYDFTAFAISAEGQYKIWKTQDKVITRFVDWTNLPALADTGGTIKLTATCAGSHLSLAVGDTVVGEAEDPAPIAGDIGLLAGLRDAGKLEVDFDNLVVSQP